MNIGNTKYGNRALENNINGSNNSSFGICSSRDTDASWNTSFGAYANMNNVSGISNSAFGCNSLLLNIGGSYNTGLGTATLLNNLSNSNTAVGSNSMENNVNGKENVAIGVQSGYQNNTGEKNTFIGAYAGMANVDGSENIFLGINSGNDNQSGFGNTLIGANSKNTLLNNYATAIGYNSDALINNGVTLGRTNDTVLIPGSGYISNVNSSNQIITKSYVDTYVTTGIYFVPPCSCATTSDINLSSPLSSNVDGYTPVNGDRILVRCQGGSAFNESTLNLSNGIYNYYSSGPPYFVRTFDCSSGDIVSGQSTFIRNGIENKNWLFRQDISNAAVDSVPLEYIKVYQLTFELGNGLDFSGNVLNVKSDLTSQTGLPFLTNVTITGDVSVNQHLFVGNGIDSCGNIYVFDDTPISTTNESIALFQKNNNNVLAFSLNPISGAYSSIVNANDNLIVGGNKTLLNKPLTITTWSATGVSNGIRMSDTQMIMGIGGTSSLPENRITFSANNIDFDSSSSSSMRFNNSITMNSIDPSYRRIYTGHLNLTNVNGTSTSIGSHLYQSNNTSTWDNDANGGLVQFVVNDISGVQFIPLGIDSSGITLPNTSSIRQESNTYNSSQGNKFCKSNFLFRNTDTTNGTDAAIVQMYDDGTGSYAGAGIYFVVNSSSGVLNSIVNLHDSIISSRSPVNNSSLTLTTYGGPKNGIRISVSSPTSGSVTMQSGNNSIVTNATSNISITGDTSFNAFVDISSIIVRNDASLNGKLKVNGDTSFNNILDVSYLIVRNDTSLNGKLKVNGDASFNNILDVSYLIVRNDTSLNSKLKVNGDVSFNNILDVSYLIVRNDASLNGKLKVNGDASFGSNVSILGNCTAKIGPDASNNYAYLSGICQSGNVGDGSGWTNFNFNNWLYSSRVTTINDLNGTSGPFGNFSSSDGNDWYNLINIRHRGGESDGNYYGSQIVTGMNNVDVSRRMAFRGQYNSSGNWTPWNEVAILNNGLSQQFTSDVSFNSNVDINGRLKVINSDIYVNNVRFGIGTGDVSTNTVIGYNSGTFNTLGNNNVFMGYQTGYSNTIGTNNTFVGYRTGFANTTGSYNTFIGGETYGSTVVSNSSAIGYGAVVDTSNTIVIGRTQETTKIPGNVDISGQILARSDISSNNISTTTGYLSIVADNSYSIVNKQYVDGLFDTSGSQPQSFTTGYGLTLNQSNILSVDSCLNQMSYLGAKTDISGTIWLNSGNNDIQVNSIKIGSGKSTDNILIGNNNGQVGQYNTFIGKSSGQFSSSNSTRNSFMGCFSGKNIAVGSNNSFFGYYSGSRIKDGSDNICIGYFNNGNDSSTTSFTLNAISSLGTYAGEFNSGNENTMIGHSSGRFNNGFYTTSHDEKGGYGNTFIGNYSGYNNNDGSLNVFIGYRSGYNVQRENGKNKNILLGANTDISGSNINNSTGIGYNVILSESNQIVIGTSLETTYIPGKLKVSNDVSFNSNTTIQSCSAIMKNYYTYIDAKNMFVTPGANVTFSDVVNGTRDASMAFENYSCNYGFNLSDPSLNVFNIYFKREFYTPGVQYYLTNLLSGNDINIFSDGSNSIIYNGNYIVNDVSINVTGFSMKIIYCVTNDSSRNYWVVK